jgi:hypothetical protein
MHDGSNDDQHQKNGTIFIYVSDQRQVKVLARPAVAWASSAAAAYLSSSSVHLSLSNQNKRICTVRIDTRFATTATPAIMKRKSVNFARGLS